MAFHLYKVGQLVSVRLPLPDRTYGGHFEILGLMPASVDGELHYRVRGPDKVERAVGEGQLSASSWS